MLIASCKCVVVVDALLQCLVQRDTSMFKEYLDRMTQAKTAWSEQPVA